MKIRHSFVVLAAVLAFASTTLAEVLSLDSSNVDSELADESQPWFIEFYAPWCGHCKRLEPVYAELAIELKGEVKVAKVDGTQNKPLSQRFSVRGFPSIFFIKDGSVYVYKGTRTKEAFVRFAREGYKDTTALSLFSSPLGPIGRAKGAVFSVGKSIVEVYERYTSKGYSKWLVVGIMTITGIFSLVAVMGIAVYLAVPADPPPPAQRPHQD